MFDNSFLDFATVSAVVAALVSVLGNAFNIPVKFRALIAIVIGVFLVSVPTWLLEKSVMALLIGLTASGVYTQVKKRDYPVPVDQQQKENPPRQQKLPPINGPDEV